MLGFDTLADTVVHRSPRRLRMVGVSFALTAALLAASAGTALGWDAGAFSSADEQLLLSLTNQDRASGGLNALVSDGYLHTKAEWRSKDMGDRNYFSHAIPPSGSKVFDSMAADGYCFSVAGENIGLSTYDDASATASIERAFMGSSSHRANIMGTWARIGVGAYKAADGRKLYTVLFSIPCGVTVPKPPPPATPVPTPTPTPTPVPTGPFLPDPTPTPTAPPTPQPSSHPTTAHGATGGSGGSGGSGASPAAGSTPTASYPASAAPSASAAGSPATPTNAAPSAGASGAAGTPGRTDAAAAPTSSKETSLRVHEKAASGGPIDSFLHAIFGGLFGW
jgi:uncharacterized protein YkwD